MDYAIGMDIKTTTTRNTKYSSALKEAISMQGHATNADLLRTLKDTFPELSATTVHRITARLAESGDIAIAPPSRGGAVRYDHNTLPHDHFMCTGCDGVRDVDIKDELIDLLTSSMDDCHISGRLTISGICSKCKEDH